MNIQEEVPSLGKPVLVLQEVTERPEAVEVGAVRVMGLDKDKIVREGQSVFDDGILYKKMSKTADPNRHITEVEMFGKAFKEIANVSDDDN